ncbi:hypothetical protein HCX48_09800 [Rhodocyclus tenuis]|uniref:Nitrogenase-associated protein n=2 Tax=Rhodocyclus TaxID=1064 RepID=A0A6L5K019_RHOTE|nr:ArsC/Spx/MgsR family protein [Rhodocyclus gracilis]MQY52170.1 hypothetical protein [Rhodocyclus gracilis]MRD72400.1 hypothetical protein [Rhodocyclus gracilis]NJA89514.1 hypothetical protein [Rhodocyclus gracilis]
MAHITFYEKSGCSGNARQKALLIAAGHEVLARDLRKEAWSRERLLAFFGTRPVAQWFNRNAPAVKSGEIVPETLTAEAAMALLLREPLLIRRPLLEVGETRQVGFDPVAIDAWIGLGEACPADIDTCRHGDETAARCRDPLAE